MSVNLSPIGNSEQFFDNNGIPLAGGLLYAYQAGSSTPLATYTTISGTVANANPIVLNSSGRLDNEVWLTYGYFYKFVLKDASGNLLGTYDNIYGIVGVQSAVGTTIPTGLISLWYGDIGSVPSGWYLCDGANGTPDLRDRFVVGAGSTYAVAATGGNATNTLITANLPDHVHTGTTGNNTSIAHTHSTGAFLGNFTYAGGGSTAGSAGSGTTGSTEPPSHTHTFSTSTTVNAASTPISNIPPYYALAYVMKA